MTMEKTIRSMFCTKQKSEVTKKNDFVGFTYRASITEAFSELKGMHGTRLDRQPFSYKEPEPKYRKYQGTNDKGY